MAWENKFSRVRFSHPSRIYYRNMPESPSTRPSLLLRIRQAADFVAWKEFADIYGPMLYGYFRRRGLQDADAGDLAQEVLGRVVAKAGELDYDRNRGTFRGWLLTLARHELADFFKRRQRNPSANGDDAALVRIPAAGDPEAEQSAWDRQYEEQVFRLAADRVRPCVDETTWRAFWQTAVEARAGREVAADLKMSVGAVYMAKSRVLARLRRVVERIEGDDDGPAI
jgi:RNA polymerase sigma factor (sigma-70 family)